jgi:hypothetical protein
MAKYHASLAAGNIVEVLGGSALIEESPVARHYRDVRVLRIGGGADEIQLEILSREHTRDATASAQPLGDGHPFGYQAGSQVRPADRQPGDRGSRMTAETDVLIVGTGPAGLCASILLSAMVCSLARERHQGVSVVARSIAASAPALGTPAPLCSGGEVRRRQARIQRVERSAHERQAEICLGVAGVIAAKGSGRDRRDPRRAGPARERAGGRERAIRPAAHHLPPGEVARALSSRYGAVSGQIHHQAVDRTSPRPDASSQERCSPMADGTHASQLAPPPTPLSLATSATRRGGNVPTDTSKALAARRGRAQLPLPAPSLLQQTDNIHPRPSARPQQ